MSGDHCQHRPAHRLTTLEFRQRLPPRRLGICRVRSGFPEGIPSLESLGMPAELHNVGNLKNGIVLVRVTA